MTDQHLEHMFDKLHEKPEAPIQQAIDAAVPEGATYAGSSISNTTINGKHKVWVHTTSRCYTGYGPTLDAAIADAVGKIKGE